MGKSRLTGTPFDFFSKAKLADVGVIGVKAEFEIRLVRFWCRLPYCGMVLHIPRFSSFRFSDVVDFIYLNINELSALKRRVSESDVVVSPKDTEFF